ncbi:hypothetical protein CLH_0194 [Clostridium botulinum E3 str. Alaska E43]|nr:hypothetical protein CLH_0194 [Clostridium botulinum E3 str. Alaska E43]
MFIEIKRKIYKLLRLKKMYLDIIKLKEIIGGKDNFGE